MELEPYEQNRVRLDPVPRGSSCHPSRVSTTAISCHTREIDGNEANRKEWKEGCVVGGRIAFLQGFVGHRRRRMSQVAIH